MILPGQNIDTTQLDTETLLENFEKLGTIFNTLREIIFTVDIEKGMIENVNNSIELLGYTKNEWEGQKFREWPFKRKKRFFALIKHASLSDVNAASKQILFPTKDNSLFIPFELTAAIYIFKNKRYLLCVLRDISEREKLLLELEQSLQKERQLNELRSGFISNASHQFRTPLTIIQSGIEIMGIYLEGLPAEKRQPFYKQFNHIQGEVVRLQELMDDILFLGRSDAKRNPFKPERSNLVEFCIDLIQNKYNSRYADNRKVLIKVTGKEQLIYFDHKLLGHSIENVLSNAYKYSKQGNIQMLISFEFDIVKISITDKGIGIPENDLANLFQPFYRAGNTTEIEGTGLGLSIVKNFINEHSGQVFVISELDKGTTVTISLPLNKKDTRNAE